MPYRIEFLEDKGIVLVESIGELTYKEFVKETQEAQELARKKNTRLFLSDCSRLIVKAGTLELFDFPAMYQRIGSPKTSKIAVLMSGDTTTDKDIRFYETVCQNRGWQVMAFMSRDEAVKWLLGGGGT